jgi:hypothetical protein
VIDVLGPVPLNPSGRITYPWFKDSSHTRNGHSVVLKLTYNQRSFLLGGDLNAASEEYLLQRYQGREDLIKSDVTKSCHHGASDFTVDFLKVISPHATVFSSGDNESYAHPRADALGASGRYGRGTCPLIFSTELARSVRKSGDILFGMINLRSDGDKIVMAQMKEKASGRNLWDAYEVPFKPIGH